MTLQNLTKRVQVRSAGGFTLIELLVVISIVALLISLMLPSLSSSREVAKKVVCASQLKQITMSHLIYADAHKGWFPFGNWATQAAWGQDKSASNTSDPNLSIKEWYGDNLKLFVCPTYVYAGTGSAASYSYLPGKETTVTGHRMVITSYKITAARFNRALTNWTYYGGHPVFISNANSIIRNDNRIVPVIPNLNFAGMVKADPENNNRYYTHPPDMMPLGMDGIHTTAGTWDPYATAASSVNNHANLNGINISFLDGHQIWAVQKQSPNRMQMYSTGSIFLTWP